MPPHSVSGATSVRSPLAAMAEERDVVAVPLALEALVRVVHPLESQELRELRVALEQLLARSERVIREEPAAAAARGHVDQPAKRGRRVREPVRGVAGVKVEDRAGVRLTRPGEKALGVTLDESDRTVDAIDAVGAKILGYLAAKVGERVARHGQLTADLGRRVLGSRFRVEPRVVIVDVRAQLMRVRPVDLAVGAKVMRGVRVPRGLLIEMCEPEEPLPVLRGKRDLVLGNRRVVRYRTIARENAATEEVGRPRIERELKVAELEPISDSLVEARNETVGRLDLDRAAYLHSRRQPDRDGVDEAEEAVPATHEPEELRVLRAAARSPVAGRVDERQ